MILVLSRGHVCPKDHQQHVQLAAFYPQLVAGYTQIVTIATDNIIIQEYTGPHDDPMIPHTLVQMPGLVIHSVYNGYRYWSRRSIDDLYRDLPEVTREIRPDWDLSEPGLRENWEKGDRSLHYSYKEADLARGPGKPIREPEAGSHGAGCRAGRRTPSSGESGGVSGGVGGSVAPQEGVTVRVGASGSPLQMSWRKRLPRPPGVRRVVVEDVHYREPIRTCRTATSASPRKRSRLRGDVKDDRRELCPACGGQIDAYGVGPRGDCSDGERLGG